MTPRTGRPRPADRPLAQANEPREGMEVSERSYQRLALEEVDRQWELHRGRLREKPPMRWEHLDVSSYLGHLLQFQLNRKEFRVFVEGGRLRRTAKNYYIPDVSVVPVELGESLRGRPGQLAFFNEPLPLVVEVWSQSTGDYDVNDKIPEYRRRGDREIWRLHPYERTLTAWRRQPDGSYAETQYRGGVVRVEALPNVTIDLDQLFDA